MTFLAPIFLVAGAVVASAIVLLHFLARRRPRPAVLPTARFVPDRPARWPSRAPRPSDWLLLAIRVLAILAIASAFAGPLRERDRAITTRIVLADRSRAVGDERALRDSVRAVLREGDVLIPFDTSARVLSPNTRDTSAALARSAAPASLSVALIAAERVAASVRDRADSLELTIVSPLASESWDEAMPTLRRRWRGRARLIALGLASGDSASPVIDVRAPRSDPVSAAAAPFATSGEPRARIVRVAPTADDSIWAGTAGHVLVLWPRGRETDSLTAEAVVAEEVVLAAPLVRRTVDAHGGLIVARFTDGTPAIVERAHGEGCIRDVAFDFPPGGDIPLRESARRLVAIAAAACDRRRAPRVLAVSELDSLRGAGSLLAASAVPRVSRAQSAATPWLLIVGALLLVLELGVRRRAVST